MRVLLMPSNVDGNGYYRCLFPGRELGRLGHDVGWVPHQVVRRGGSVMLRYEWLQGGEVFPIDRALLALDFDVLLMGYRSDPGSAGMVRALRAQGKRVVVDCDDDWLNVPSYNPGSRAPKAEVAEQVRLLEAADVVSVSTPALAVTYGGFCGDVRVVRNGLDWLMWADVARPVSERFRVGWMGELHWRRGDLEVLRGVLGPWLSLNPDVEFVAAGDPAVHDFLGVPEGQRVSVAPTQFWWFDLADITATFDVGLVPLARNLLNEGKSHLKGMEYNACGVPFVASPSESYRWWLDGNGLLASTASEWREALDRLKGDAGLRLSLGARGRELAREHSIQERAGEWESVVCVPDRDVAGPGGAAR